MTRISEQELERILRNPDIAVYEAMVRARSAIRAETDAGELCAEGVAHVQRPEPERARAYRKAHPYCPTEAQDQRAVMDWAAAHTGQHPALRFLFHVPNEGNRGDMGQIRAVADGLRSGVPDLLLPVARGEYIGLAIELKRADRSNHPTPEQWQWIEGMRGNRWCVAVCYGYDAAVAVLQDYLTQTNG